MNESMLVENPEGSSLQLETDDQPRLFRGIEELLTTIEPEKATINNVRDLQNSMFEVWRYKELVRGRNGLADKADQMDARIIEKLKEISDYKSQLKQKTPLPTPQSTPMPHLVAIRDQEKMRELENLKKVLEGIDPTNAGTKVYDTLNATIIPMLGARYKMASAGREDMVIAMDSAYNKVFQKLRDIEHHQAGTPLLYHSGNGSNGTHQEQKTPATTLAAMMSPQPKSFYYPTRKEFMGTLEAALGHAKDSTEIMQRESLDRFKEMQAAPVKLVNKYDAKLNQIKKRYDAMLRSGNEGERASFANYLNYIILEARGEYKSMATSLWSFVVAEGEKRFQSNHTEDHQEQALSESYQVNLKKARKSVMGYTEMLDDYRLVLLEPTVQKPRSLWNTICNYVKNHLS